MYTYEYIVTMETPNDQIGACDGESVIALYAYGAISCNFRTDSRFQVTNEYLLVNKLHIS